MYYKILRKDLTHYGYTYTIGLNIDTNKFNHSECGSGGLYFTTKKHIHEFLIYGDYIADIEIPKGAQCYKFKNKYKAEAVIIKSIIPIAEHELLQDSAVRKRVLKSLDGLKYLKNPTEEEIALAISLNGLNLQYAPKQTFELALQAIRQNPFAIRYVSLDEGVNADRASSEVHTKKYYQLAKLAVKLNGLALQFVRQSFYTDELLLEAVTSDGGAIKFIKDPPDQLKKLADLTRLFITFYSH